MPQPKAVLRFVSLLAVVYSLLAFPARLSPTWEHAYASVFRSGGNMFFSRFWFWPQARVKFLDLRSETLLSEVNAAIPGQLPPEFELPRPTQDMDTLLVLLNRNAPGSVGMHSTGSNVMGYVPTAVLVSLILVTPLAWSRRGWMIAWGLVAVHGLIAVRLTAVVLFHGFAEAGQRYALFHPGSFFKSVWERADDVLADNPTFAYVAPVCLWLAILLGFAFWDRRRAGQAGEKRTAAAGR